MAIPVILRDLHGKTIPYAHAQDLSAPTLDDVGVLIMHDTRCSPPTRTFRWKGMEKLNGVFTVVFIEIGHAFIPHCG